LAHIRCDSINQGGRSPSKFGEAAVEHVRQRIRQRNVEVEITGVMDKKERAPSWTGKVWINGADIALELLEKGLASVFVPADQKAGRGGRAKTSSTIPNGYLEAEAAAREKEVGRWKEIVAKRLESEEKRKKNEMTGKEKIVVVSQVDSGVSFWVNPTGNNELESLEEKMSRIPRAHPGKIRIGKMVAALFDGLYCRANVIKQRGDRLWQVIFVDYGNSGTIEEQNFTALPPDLHLSQCPQLAQRCQLAALRSPPRSSEYFTTAGQQFAASVMPFSSETKTEEQSKRLMKELKVKVIYDDYWARRWHVVLMDQATSVNEAMLKEGYVRFDHKGKETPEEIFASEDESTKEYLKTMKKLSEEALEARRGFYGFGDVDSDDEALF